MIKAFLVVRLASALKVSRIAVWMYGAGAVVPLIGLFVMLAINRKATGVLRGAGFRVGFMGTGRLIR